MSHFEIEKKKKREKQQFIITHIQIQTVKKINNNSFIHRNQFALIVEERR
jgi:hypothetical protein